MFISWVCVCYSVWSHVLCRDSSPKKSSGKAEFEELEKTLASSEKEMRKQTAAEYYGPIDKDTFSEENGKHPLKVLKTLVGEVKKAISKRNEVGKKNTKSVLGDVKADPEGDSDAVASAEFLRNKIMTEASGTAVGATAWTDSLEYSGQAIYLHTQEPTCVANTIQDMKALARIVYFKV